MRQMLLATMPPPQPWIFFSQSVKLNIKSYMDEIISPMECEKN